MTVDTPWQHTTVLLSEAVDALDLQPDGTYIDATFGRGGHTRLMLSKLSDKGRVIAFDKDPEAIAAAQQIQDPRLSIRHEGFAHLGDLPPASVDGVLMDLGISSPQVDNPARGFSFRHDGPLDMRMDTTRGQSVQEWLVEADIQHIAEVIREYGEERFALQIAKAIDARRQERGVPTSTAELAQLVADTVKTREPGKDPATRTFQAFRIFINAELEELQQALDATLQEDRIVKQFIAQHAREVYDRRAPFAPPQVMDFKAVQRIKPSEQEIANNPRARSAILRVAERLPSPQYEALS